MQQQEPSPTSPTIKTVQEVTLSKHDDNTETEEFEFKNGLRYVKPYYFDYTTHSKGRWIGQTVFQMYTKEFSYYTEDYVRKAIEAKRITIDGRDVVDSTVIKRNQLLCHRLHRHELPVLNVPIKVIPCDNDKLIVLDKPASYPVHPCGRYRKNSMTYLLMNECNLGIDLYPIHRLDRMTSGILVISKSKQFAQQMTDAMTKTQIKKVYLAVASGKWPDYDSTKHASPISECTVKIWCKDKRSGLWEANDEKGVYHAKTVFSCVAYDAVTDMSLLLCRPITGRTHQIRVHLQAMGHPIANDPIYGHGAEQRRDALKRKLQADRESKKEEPPSKRSKSEESVDFSNIAVESTRHHKTTKSSKDTRQRIEEKHKYEESSANTNSIPSHTPTFDPLCNECVEELIKPREPHELFIYLHSWVYISPGHWNVKSEVPFWVAETFPSVTQDHLDQALDHLFKETQNLDKESVHFDDE